MVRGEEGEEWVEAAVRVLALVANAYARSAVQRFLTSGVFRVLNTPAPSANQR
ncbi:hypothetical protein GH141_05180 [bacterium]|nr:hypothetical protein [bacterium]